MASEHAPDELREDPLLRQAFPAKPLAGLDWELCWHSLEQIIQNRDAALDLIRQGREEENANWVRAGTEDLEYAERIYPKLKAPLANVVSLAARRRDDLKPDDLQSG